MKPMIRIAAALALSSWIFALCACATANQSSQTEKTRENADQGMQNLHQEEGNGY